MPKALAQETRVPTRDELKEILSAEAPCITLITPLEGPRGPARQGHVRMKHEIAEVERMLQRASVDPEQIRNLLQPISDFAEESEPGDGKPGALAIPRSSGLFRVMRLGCP